MRISEIEKVLKKIKKDRGNCTITDIFINNKRINIYMEDENKESFIFSKNFDEKEKLLKFGSNINYTRDDVFWGNKTDKELDDYNKEVHW